MKPALMPLQPAQPHRPKLADSAGLLASACCAVHCAAMPLLVAYLPLLGLEWLAGEWFHQAMAVVCSAFAAAAFVPGWRRHRSIVPVSVGVAGLVLLGAAAFGLEGQHCPDCIPAAQGPYAEPASAASIFAGSSSILLSLQDLRLAPWLTPLMTPLGGLLLSVGHLTNHWKLCDCQERCCKTGH